MYFHTTHPWTLPVTSSQRDATSSPGCMPGQLPTTVPEHTGFLAQNVPRPSTLTPSLPNGYAAPHSFPAYSRSTDEAFQRVCAGAGGVSRLSIAGEELAVRAGASGSRMVVVGAWFAGVKTGISSAGLGAASTPSAIMPRQSGTAATRISFWHVVLLPVMLGSNGGEISADALSADPVDENRSNFPHRLKGEEWRRRMPLTRPVVSPLGAWANAASADGLATVRYFAYALSLRCGLSRGRFHLAHIPDLDLLCASDY
jgi:hypothetical protein